MLSQGLMFAFCTTLLALTAADEKEDLIKDITDLRKGIQNVTDEIASFEKQKSSELNQVKENYTSSLENANKSKNQLKDFKNDFCESKLKSLIEYDYEAETTSSLKNETENYNKVVTPITEKYRNYLKPLDDMKQRVQTCEDDGCISTEKTSFEKIKQVVDLSKNKDEVEKEILKFKNIILEATTSVINTIKNRETVTESCFNELAKVKNEIDEFKTNISKAIEELNNDYAKAEEVIDQVNQNFSDSLSSVIKKTISQVQAHEDEATQKNVNIEACNATTLDGTLEQIKKEFLQFFDADDVKSYQNEMNVLINTTITTAEEYSSKSQDLENRLKTCDSTDCMENIKQVLDGNFTRISHDINDNLNAIPIKISECQSDIYVSKKVMENTFSSQVESKAQFIMDCIILKVNVADIKTIQSTIISATNILGDTITQLNTKAWITKNSWQQKQQDCLQDLDEYIYDILLNVTSHENKAFSHSVGIEDCLKNKSQLHDPILTGTSKEIGSKIDTHYKKIEETLKDDTNNLNNHYISIQDLVEVLRQCQQSDADCISKAKNEIDEKLDKIKESEVDATKKLDSLVVSSNKTIESEIQVIENDAKGDAYKTADAIIKCIKESIDKNSALSFAPTSLVIFIALFAHLLCHSYL